MKSRSRTVLLYLLYLVVLQETLLRLAFPLPELRNFGRASYMPVAVGFASAEVRQVRNVNLVVESAPDRTRFVHRLNAYGFRDREWRIEKPAGVKRFFFVGDSFAEGEGAETGDTISESFRRRAEATGKSFDVMNLGIMAADLESYIRLIVDATPIYEPDYVVLVLFANDFAKTPELVPSDYRPLYFHPYRPRLVEVVSAIRSGEAVPFRWRRREQSFFQAAPSRLNPWSEHETELREYVSPEMARHILDGKFNPYVPGALAAQERYLKKPIDVERHLVFLKEFLDEQRATLQILYVPSRHQVSTAYVPFERTFCLPCPAGMDLTGAPYQQHAAYLAETCQRLVIPFIDLTPGFRTEESRGKRLYWSYDEHLTGTTYRRVGEWLYDSWYR